MRPTFAITLAALLLGSACASTQSSARTAAMDPASGSPRAPAVEQPRAPAAELATTETVPIPVRGPTNLDHLSAPPPPSTESVTESDDGDETAAPTASLGKKASSIDARR